MKGYQDSYAVAMSKYGLKRGIEGSKAKHRTTAEYYRDTFEQAQVLREKDRPIIEKDSLIVTQKGKIDRLFDYFPVLSEYDFIMRLCELIKILANIVKQLFAGKDVDYSGSLYSPEHKQSFEAENVKIAIGKSAKDNKPMLAIEGMEYGKWFRIQKQKFLESIGIKVNENKKTQQMRR
jgi:hypothetical protein